MIVHQVRDQAPASNGVQNYTISGFGTPDWCLVICGGTAESAWSTSTDTLSIGAYDGTTQICVGMGGEDGSTPNGVTHCVSDNASVVHCEWDSVADRRTASADFIADGVELTWAGGDTSFRPYTTVIMGSGGTAKVGWHTASDVENSPGGTSSETGLGITPKLMVLASRLSDSFGGGELGRFSIGFAADNGTSIDQKSKVLRCNDTDPMDYNAHVSSDRAVMCECNLSGVPAAEIEITNMSAGQFDTRTYGDSGFGSSFMYFALECDEDVLVWDDATPTSAGDWDPFTSTFTPQWVFMLPTCETTLNSDRGGGEDVVEEWGLYSVIDATGEEFGHYLTYENGATGAGSTLYRGRADQRLEINTVESSAPVNKVAGAVPIFDSSGIVYEDAAFDHDVSARQVIGFAVQQEVAVTGNPVLFKILHEGHLNG